MKVFRSDDGGEFCDNSLQSFFESKGISHQKSCPYTLEQNGIAERKHRHIVETAISLIFHSFIPLEFWPYAFSTAVFLINRMPSPSLHTLSPFENLFGNTPDLRHLKVFECACYPLQKPYTKHKLEPKITQHIFLGYPHNFKGYLCYNPSVKQTIVSRHVIFHETIFPFVQSSPSSPSHTKSISDPNLLLTLLNLPQSSNSTSSQSPTSNSPTADNTCSPFMDTNVTHQSLNVSSIVDTGNAIDVFTTNAPTPRNTHAMQTREKSGIFKPKAFHITTTIPTLTSYTETSKYPEWRNAMCEEFNALQAQGTWSLVPRHPSMNIVGYKWVFRIKYNPDGSVARHKARLVAKDYHQIHSFDFDETFSPVVKKPTIRIILSLAAQYSWSLTQLDVKNAFLHNILTETVYMSQPTGFQEKICLNHVCLLHKGFYGLKQAPHAWFKRFTSYLFTLGFITSNVDPSFFSFDQLDLLSLTLVCR
ncbi:hypothetical protein IC582_026309 [Cucumis melo]